MADHPAIAWRELILSQHVTLPAPARLIGCALAQYVHKDGTAYPSATTLATCSGLSERAARTHLHTLREAGLLKVVSQGGTLGGTRTTVYRITLTPAPSAAVTPAPPAGVGITTPAPHNLTPADDVTTPAPPAPELEELDELEREPLPLADLASSLILHHPEEAAAAVAGAVARWGNARVHELVNAYAVAGTQFTYASELRRRIDLDAPQRPIAAVRERCNECNGAGYVLPIGSDIAVRCACTKAVSA